VTSSVRTMRAMRASGPDPASLACETIPVPEPGPDELLVEVQATAVTADELTWRAGPLAMRSMGWSASTGPVPPPTT